MGFQLPLILEIDNMHSWACDRSGGKASTISLNNATLENNVYLCINIIVKMCNIFTLFVKLYSNNNYNDN